MTPRPFVMNRANDASDVRLECCTSLEPPDILDTMWARAHG